MMLVTQPLQVDGAEQQIPNVQAIVQYIYVACMDAKGVGMARDAE
jgi:hypothetical protein